MPSTELNCIRRPTAAAGFILEIHLTDSDRLYYSDPFLRSFTASVSGVREGSAAGPGSLWQVSLDRSAFYPTSGGQPFDTGLVQTTTTTRTNKEIPVEQVEEDESG